MIVELRGVARRDVELTARTRQQDAVDEACVKALYQSAYERHLLACVLKHLLRLGTRLPAQTVRRPDHSQVAHVHLSHGDVVRLRKHLSTSETTVHRHTSTPVHARDNTQTPVHHRVSTSETTTYRHTGIECPRQKRVRSTEQQ